MRQRQAAVHAPAERIVIRDTRAPTTRAKGPAVRSSRRETQVADTVAKTKGQASMAYQMGFTSGPSN